MTTEEELIRESLLHTGILRSSRQGIIRRWDNKKTNRVIKTLVYVINKIKGAEK